MPATPEDFDLLRRNRLLALLDEPILAALAAEMTHVAMQSDDVVMTEGRPIRSAWFPTDGVLSMLARADGSRQRVEVGTVGHEGFSASSVLLGTARAPVDCFVQVSGHSWRMPAAALMDVVRTHPPLAQVLHRYTQAFMVQAMQGVACNRTHSALERCARWLLMTDDRVEGDSFDLKQEYLAQMLGERRATVSHVASTLRDRRLITYSRGRITVLDRKQLEQVACPCYKLVRNEYDSMLRPARRGGH